MLTYTVRKAGGRWWVDGVDAQGVSRDCRAYATRTAARAAMATRLEEQAEGVAPE